MEVNKEKAGNVICATILTGLYDVNRNEVIEPNDFNKVKAWYDSVSELKINAIIFHNSFSDEVVAKYENSYVSFKKVFFDSRYNANIFRYLVYRHFLQENREIIQNVFVTDITDVVVLKNPFEEEYFKQNTNALFCGDEEKCLDNDWMNDHATHLRNSIREYADFEAIHKKSILLNCGIIGGSISTMLSLMEQLSLLHENYSLTNKSAFTLDMGAFNFIARTQFDSRIIHGKPVNTIFKEYQNNNEDCWFRHK